MKSYRITSASGVVFTLAAKSVTEQRMGAEVVVTFTDAAHMERSFTDPQQWSQIDA